MKKKERPQIELYMYSLNQEFPVGKGHTNFLKQNTDRYIDGTGNIVGIKQIANQILKTLGAGHWLAQWVSNQWVQNYTYYPGGALVEEGDPLLQMVIREEEFGAILFDRINDRIYKVNKAGLKLFNEIVKVHKKDKLFGFKSSDFKREDVENFISFLKGAAIWPSKQ